MSVRYDATGAGGFDSEPLIVLLVRTFLKAAFIV